MNRTFPCEEPKPSSFLRQQTTKSLRWITVRGR